MASVMVASSSSRVFSVGYLTSFRSSPPGETTPAAIFVPPTSIPMAFIVSPQHLRPCELPFPTPYASAPRDRRIVILLYSSHMVSNTLTLARSAGGEDAIPRLCGHHYGQWLGARTGSGSPFCGGGRCCRRCLRSRAARGHGSR